MDKLLSQTVKLSAQSLGKLEQFTAIFWSGTNCLCASIA